MCVAWIYISSINNTAGAQAPATNRKAMKQEITAKVTIVLEYNDESETSFDVTIKGSESEILGTLSMVTRGTLMASIAKKATCYREDGFELCSYIK
mgnify:CR=1 FL=1